MDYECCAKRYDLIVLDLDNTLIYSSNTNKGDGIQTSMIAEDGEVKNFWIHKRPYCDIFLNLCFKYSNVGVWSTGSKEYVDMIVNLFPNKPKFVFSRENCEIVDGKQTKPLDEIPFGGRTIMIDDQSVVLTEREEVDTIVVPSWYPNMIKDKILLTIIPLLFKEQEENCLI